MEMRRNFKRFLLRASEFPPVCIYVCVYIYIERLIYEKSTGNTMEVIYVCIENWSSVVR